MIALLVDYRSKTWTNCYHVIPAGAGRPLCGRRLNPQQITTHRRTISVIVKVMDKYDQPGGVNGMNACAQCRKKLGTLKDPVTRLGDVVR